MSYQKEKEMYEDVKRWLEIRFKNMEKRGILVKIFDTHDIFLSNFLQRRPSFKHFFPEYSTYEIKVDITGFLIDRERNIGKIIFIECKLGKITLGAISQLLGYSRVAKPILSILLSPKGVSTAVNNLLNKFNRKDVLEYGKEKFIIIGKWDKSRKEILPNSIIPREGSLLLQKLLRKKHL